MICLKGWVDMKLFEHLSHPPPHGGCYVSQSGSKWSQQRDENFGKWLEWGKNPSLKERGWAMYACWESILGLAWGPKRSVRKRRRPWLPNIAWGPAQRQSEIAKEKIEKILWESSALEPRRHICVMISLPFGDFIGAGIFQIIILTEHILTLASGDCQ